MALPVEPNYFTCTLGEGLRWKESHPGRHSFRHVIDLVDTQARDNSHSPAIGFSAVDRTHGQNQGSCLTFNELAAQSIAAASCLREIIPQDSSTRSIGLLCTSSFEFVLTWLGLTRLGFSVLLLAPQLEGQSIRHLCKSLSIEAVLTDARQEGRCASVKEHITIFRIPLYPRGTPNSAQNKPATPTTNDTAIWFHSSGTSTGLPKAISQTHGGLVATLPNFPGPEKPATFSTTPLYHGGLVDALRAWTSGAMIWFFPEGEAPITGANVGKAVEYARSVNVARVGYFSSVPYILQMLADEQAGLELLRSMELVGVGGAALPELTGDRLVRQGVHLLSRMGSAECGFLMSSHRNYLEDKDWQYLRPVDDPSLIEFEPRDDRLSELVVKSGWPHLAKGNRDDGSYVTSDLFEPHHEKAGLWRYHSRADAQVTLSNGKKFDPSPLEASILASTTLLADVLIFGDSRDYPGALLIPSGEERAQDLISSIWPVIDQLNADTQSHARLAKSMIVIAEPRGRPGLEKSSKGTILRKKAEARFAEEIDRAYSQLQAQCCISDSTSREELQSAVTQCFSQVLGRQVDSDQDLYVQGVDSIACIQIRSMIQNSCLPSDSQTLPLNVLYDKVSINNFVSYLWHLRQGPSNGDTIDDMGSDEANGLKAMMDLTAKYARALPWSLPQNTCRGEVVVLTGATGFLGSHILCLLLMSNQVKKVICPIRASSAAQAQNRLEATLRLRGYVGGMDPKVVCTPCDLTREDLGVTVALKGLLTTKATLIIHSAWAVNFSLHILSFEDQIRGTANLLNLASQAGAKMIFISSTAAVSHAAHSHHHSAVTEVLSKDPKDASPLGYSQSKWVAEQICAAATDREGPSASLPADHAVLIIRVGQLCGDERGVWNESEAYPLMLSTARIVGCLPAIKGEVVNWMPVHVAAQVVLDITFQASDQASLDQSNIFHVTNHHNTPSWEQMLHWLQEGNNESESGPSFEVKPPSQWVSTLQGVAQRGGEPHPAYALLGLWKNAFEEAVDNASDGPPDSLTSFDTTRSQQASSLMRSLKPLDKEQLLRMWRWVNHALP